MNFTPCTESIIYKRKDPCDLRLGDLNEKVLLDDSHFILAGYPDDEGIRVNGGRIGASEAPDKIRSYLSRMTPSCEYNAFPNYYDIGNLKVSGNLEDRHNKIIEEALPLIKQSKKWIALGGGHDFAYPDGVCFLETYAEQNPLIINFDAHLDVRPLDKGISSGTPFYRLLTQYTNFDFCEIGIQSECNSLQHKEWCKEKGGHILEYSELYNSNSSPLENIKNFLLSFTKKGQPTYLSVDIDVFSSSEAMGCSQSWPMGLNANDFHKVLNYLLQQFDVRMLGIYEVSPPLDQDDRTSKLASQIVYRYLQHG